ncbi:MAG: DUF4390 domain-containing protein [Nitrospirae bacterium]|nr:DUF4390 domain-containing protein [Nitrospirota bacterium]
MSGKKAGIITISLLILLELLAFAGMCNAAEVSEITYRISNNELYVSTMIRPDQKIMNDLNDGLSKEFIFYIDLFRVWDIWPDEFVLGTKIVAKLRSNPIKREYIAASTSGNIVREKRFNDLEAMVNWATTLSDLKLTNIRELDAGTYFVKVTAESRIRKLPPVIGYLFFFVSDKEFSVSRDSHTFQINTKGVQP